MDKFLEKERKKRRGSAEESVEERGA